MNPRANIGALILLMAVSIGHGQSRDRWIDPRCTPLPFSTVSPLATLGDGRLLRIEGNAIRTSKDDGKTWTDRQKLLDGYCGALIDMIQTKNGRIVVPIQLLLRDRTRHATRAYVSADEGKTWRRGNVLDLGGYGDHDGAMEATLAELSDGR